MKIIDNLTDGARQTSQVTLDDGSIVQLALTYLALPQRWVVDVTYGSFTVFSLNICVHPNFLRQWRNVLPFGLACIATDNVDPVNIGDWIAPADGSAPRCSLVVLNAAEIAQSETVIFEVVS